MKVKKPRIAIKTTKKQIVDYWCKHFQDDIEAVDWADAHERCWRCGSIKRLERAHIVPYALGGKDEPKNFVLLCSRCHKEGPNITNPQVMWDWLKAYSQPLYETYWGMQGLDEYQKLYHSSFADDYERLLQKSGLEEKDLGLVGDRFVELLQKNIYKVTIHYGQPYLNKATIAGLLRTTLTDLAEGLGQTISEERTKCTRQAFFQWSVADTLWKILEQERQKNNSPIFRI